MKKLAIAALAIMFMASACSKEEKPVEYGTATLSIEQGASVFVKSAATEDELDNFQISATKNGSAVSELTKKYSDLKGQTITLSTGEYVVSAENISETEAEEGRGAQRLAGSNNLTIEAGKTSSINIACSMVNAKVTFTFADSFKAMFKEDDATTPATISAITAVNTHNRAAVTYSKDATLETEEAFFTVDGSNSTLNFTITAVNNNGETKTYNNTLTLEPKTWHKVTINGSSTNGSAGITITADKSMAEKPSSVDIDPYK